MKKKKAKVTGIFSGLPPKAKVLGAQFISTCNKKSFQISYSHNGQTYSQSFSMEGGAQ